MKVASRVRLVVLDVDDTLYPEYSYVESGYAAVAAFLSGKCGASMEALYQQLVTHYRSRGRKGAFDAVLEQHGLATPIFLAAALHVYRTHVPGISLFPDVMPFIERLDETGIKSAILTDGKSCVQHAKIDALDLASKVNFVLCTDDLNDGCGKPSPIPFQIVLERLEVAPNEAVYIADDERKDFAGPNELGMHSIKLDRKLPYPLAANVAYPSTHRAGSTVYNLDEAWRILEKL
ncbi:MAG: HAD family hydrolase [Sulfuricella sp.]|nr:HAD family hydrolase [Sulfuricella sp.]